MKGTEIVVVGAGSVGANVAHRLAQRGARVTVHRPDARRRADGRAADRA